MRKRTERKSARYRIPARTITMMIMRFICRTAIRRRIVSQQPVVGSRIAQPSAGQNRCPPKYSLSPKYTSNDQLSSVATACIIMSQGIVTRTRSGWLAFRRQRSQIAVWPARCEKPGAGQKATQGYRSREPRNQHSSAEDLARRWRPRPHCGLARRRRRWWWPRRRRQRSQLWRAPAPLSPGTDASPVFGGHALRLLHHRLRGAQGGGDLGPSEQRLRQQLGATDASHQDTGA